MPPFRDLTGQSFGALRAVRYLPSGAAKPRPCWECQCRCGNVRPVSVSDLLAGQESCGYKCPFRHAARRAVAAERQRLAADSFRSGECARSIAARLGVATAHVYQLLRKAGVITDYFCDVNHDYFAKIDTEEKAYWLGFLAADGCVSDDGRIYLSLKSSDGAHVTAFRDAIGSTHAIQTVNMHGSFAGSTPALRFSVRSRKMAGDLAKCGIIPRKSLTAVPWSGPLKMMRHYWRGVVDGDGWISLPGRHGAWGVGLVGSFEMVDAFRAYMARIGGTRAAVFPCKSVWKVETRGPFKARPVIRELYEGATVALARKADLARQAIAAAPQLAAPLFNWSAVTKDQLVEAHARLGTWKAVAAEMGAPLNSLIALKRRYFGLVDRVLPLRPRA